MRILTWNLLGGRGWLPGEDPAVNPGPVRPAIPAAIGRAIATTAADLIVLQECPPRPLIANLASELDCAWLWCSPGWPGNRDWPGGFPGAILSRWPMSEAFDHVAGDPNLGQDRFRNHWGSVLVATPQGPLRLHATHLCADWGGVEREDVRLAEIADLLACLAGDPVPARLVVGDLNCQPGSAAFARLQRSGLIDVAAGVDTPTGTVTAALARWRIDHILAGGPPATWAWRARILRTSPYVPAQAGEPYLSDHLPVVADTA